jgi:hypothetical protein
LLPDDFNDAGGNVGDGGHHVAFGQFEVPHGVLASHDGYPRLDGCIDPLGDSRFEFEHIDAGTVGDNLDIYILGAEVVLYILDVIKRQIPFAGVVVTYLEYDMGAQGCRFVVPILGVQIGRNQCKGKYKQSRNALESRFMFHVSIPFIVIGFFFGFAGYAVIKKSGSSASSQLSRVSIAY